MVREVFWLTTLVALVGCWHKSELCVTASSRSSKQLTIDIREGSDCATVPRIWEVAFTPTGATTGAAWLVNVADPRPLGQVVYGQVPSGFSQGPPPQPLTPGQKLLVNVKGPGTLGGMVVTVE